MKILCKPLRDLVRLCPSLRLMDFALLELYMERDEMFSYCWILGTIDQKLEPYFEDDTHPIEEIYGELWGFALRYWHNKIESRDLKIKQLEERIKELESI